MFWQFRKSLIHQSFILVKEMDGSSIPHSLNFSTVTALNHFCEHCSLENVSKLYFVVFIIYNCLATCNQYHISLIWQVLQGRGLSIDLISEGAINLPNALNTVSHYALHYPYPQVFWVLPSFACIKTPRWWPIEQSTRWWPIEQSTSKIGDCEQSSSQKTFLIS